MLTGGWNIGYPCLGLRVKGGTSSEHLESASGEHIWCPQCGEQAGRSREVCSKNRFLISKCCISPSRGELSSWLMWSLVDTRACHPAMGRWFSWHTGNIAWTALPCWSLLYSPANGKEGMRQGIPKHKRNSITSWPGFLSSCDVLSSSLSCFEAMRTNAFAKGIRHLTKEFCKKTFLYPNNHAMYWKMQREAWAQKAASV